MWFILSLKSTDSKLRGTSGSHNITKSQWKQTKLNKRAQIFMEERQYVNVTLEWIVIIICLLTPVQTRQDWGIWKLSFQSENAWHVFCPPNAEGIFKHILITAGPHVLDLCLKRTLSGKSQEYRQLRFQNGFRPHENEKPAFSNSFGLNSVFEKLRFREGLVGSSVEMTLRFQIPPVVSFRRRLKVT